MIPLLLISVAAAPPLCGVGTLALTISEEERSCLLEKRAAKDNDSFQAAQILLHATLQQPSQAQVEADLAALDALGRPLPSYYLYKWADPADIPAWLVALTCARWATEDFSPSGPSPNVIEHALHSSLTEVCAP